MDLRPRLYWGGLAVVVALIATALTIWITHVDRSPKPVIGFEVKESNPLRIDRLRLSIASINTVRFRIPRVVMADPRMVLFMVTSGTSSIVLTGVEPRGLRCGYLEDVAAGASAEYWSDAVSREPLQRMSVAPRPSGPLVLAVPATLRRSLASRTDAQGVMACSVSRTLASKTTFTERAMTVHAQNGEYGSLMVDVSALEDVDNLRFSGGIAIPIAGERTRLMDRYDNIVSAEWTSVAAAERRDIVLVLIGGLAAIAAAMAIEAIRPFVENPDA